MFETSTLIVFMAAAAALLITPGPAVLYIVTRSLDQGRLAGIVSVIGVSLGTLVHVFAAAVGISALLVSSALAFNIVKFLGAAYLIYLGVRKLTSQETALLPEHTQHQKLWRIFYQGIIVNILNPKTALFFFAFLPQFVDAQRGSVPLQMVILGLILVTMGVFSDGVYALLAGTAGNWLRHNLKFLRIQKYVTGSIYILLGVTAALAGGQQKS
jgi:threonine/homoserine/homoserine lactone efflux protein